MTATVRALPRYDSRTQRHSWRGHTCRWCGITVRPVQADPNSPRSWMWVWPEDLTVTFDNRHGGGLPRCPLPRGTRVEVRPGACDANGRILPSCPARLLCHYVWVWEIQDGPQEWYDLLFDDGRFRTVAPSLVRAVVAGDGTHDS